MLTVRRTGASLADVAAHIPNVPRWVMPYAASTALTRVAKHAATQVLPGEMRQSFQNPTAYTLNALRVEPSTVDTLSARVMVKDQAKGRPPQNWLLPEVEGGARGHKGMEGALRYQGILRSSQFAVPASGATLDEHGNISGPQARAVLSALQKLRGYGRRSRRRRAVENDLFAGKPNGGNRPDGVWRREGKRLRMILAFTNQPPSYRPRFDFSGTVQRVALDRFRPEFERAAADLLKKAPRS